MLAHKINTKIFMVMHFLDINQNIQVRQKWVKPNTERSTVKKSRKVWSIYNA